MKELNKINIPEIGEELEISDAKARNPEFDDSGTVTGISNFTDFKNKVKSKMDIFGFFRDFKAGMKFVLHQGQIVNNLLATDPNTVLSGPMGKELKGQIDQLNSNFTDRGITQKTNYTLFSEIPVTNGLRSICVSGNGIDPDSPVPNTKDSSPYWWNIIQFSEHNRLTQIANNPFAHTARLYARVKHDDNWYPWSEFSLQSDVAETYPCNLKSNGHPITYADGSFEVGKLTLPKGRYLILFKAILRDAAIYLFIGSETVHSSAVRCWNKEEQTGTGFYVRTLTEETVITFKVALHLESSSPISLADDARYNMAYAIRL